MKTLILILIAVFLPSISHAEKIQDEKAILAIIGEAENQGTQGMVAVACGIYNRGTLKGVYGLNAPRVKKKLYSKETYLTAEKAWEFAKNAEEFMSLDEYGTPIDACHFLGGADHWENIKAFGKPYWVKDMVETYRYKDHVFYRRK